jgi:hypothetical protein
LPAWGIDPSEYLKQVVIVGANEGDRQVSLMTWISNGTNKGFTEDGSGASLRRFVASAAPVQALSPSIAARGLRAPMAKGLAESGSQYVVKRATKIDSSVWDISITYTDSHEASSLERNWRWIPNTGEYLVIGNIKLVFSNRGEISLDGNRALLGKSYSLSIGAVDRKYDAQKGGEGNIYNNKGKSFELAVLGNDTFNTNTPVLAATLTKGAADVYTTTMPSSSRFSVDEHGVVSYIVTDYMGKSMSSYDYFGVRPSSGQAYAGDDILLSATLTITNAHNEKVFWPLSLVTSGKPVNEDVRIKADEAKYLAVYDKKMLWRANLYINEDMNDWNDLHPWNAPPSGGVTATTPKWWTPEWGNNEWNREFKSSTTFLNGQSVGLNNLPIGNGGQVIQLPGYAAVRKLDSPLANTVAYSYPSHRYESSSGWASPVMLQEGLGASPGALPAFDSTQGNPGSMDSPFDYVWKMRRQGFSAPSNNWWNYTVTQPGDGAISANLGGIRYIPSLGLYLGAPAHSLIMTKPASDTQVPDTWDQAPYETIANSPELLKNPTANNLTVQKRRNASWIIEAGTDCIGFAQRAASWTVSPYSWAKLQPGMMEYNSGNGTDNPYVAMNDYGKNGLARSFPTNNTEATQDRLQVAYDIISKRSETQAPTEASTQEHLRQLKLVVPGDIWVKANTANGQKRAHIAVIAYVPPNIDTYVDPLALMNDIILIEGEYTNKIQSVIKKLSLGMYNFNLIPQDTPIYPGFDAPSVGANQGIPLNCYSWAIRRLK